jgi:long-chain acyl-CoA synthetase
MKTLQDVVNTFPSRGKKTAISWKEDGEYKSINYQDLGEMINHFGKGMLSLGLNQGDRVAIISDIDPRWPVASLGMNNVGITDVPRGSGSDSPKDEIQYILDNSDLSAAVVLDNEAAEKLERSKHPEIKHVISLKEATHPDIDMSMYDIIQKGAESPLLIPNVTPEELSTIIWTSGTTGKPKGVMLTHGNLADNIDNALDIIEFRDDDRWISFLPIWHSFQRMGEYLALTSGAENFHCSRGNFKKYVTEVKPTIMASVPQAWDAVRKGVNNLIKKKVGIKGKIEEASALKKAGFKVMKVLAKGKVKKLLGGEVRYLVSGGGKLFEESDKFFNEYLKIPLLEGLGITEASPIMAARTPDNNVIGSIGRPVRDYDMKIVDIETGEELPNGEIGEMHFSGNNIMKGYFRDQEATDKVVYTDDDGKRWFKTGDLGVRDDNGNFYHRGRNKEIVVLKNGENVMPINLEERLDRSDYIQRSAITGQDRPMLCALVDVDPEKMKEYCQENGIQYPDNIEDLNNVPEVVKLIGEEISHYVNNNPETKTHEVIPKSNFRIVSLDNYLTSTLKLKRHEVDMNLADTIQSIYV